MEILNQNRESLVEVGEVLSFFSTKREEGVEEFRKFIQSWVPKAKDIFKGVKREIVLGSNQFVKRIEGNFRSIKNRI